MSPTDAEPPFPVLLNRWKHHAAWLRWRVRAAVAGGEPGVQLLAAEAVVIGTRLMDFYTGSQTPAGIGDAILADLRADGRDTLAGLGPWLAGNGGFGVVTLPADGSRWAVRLGPADGRFVHLHPGRYSPHTVRVSATVLKSAVVAHAVAALAGRDPTDVAVMNDARRRFLALPPVPSLGAGLAEAVGLLG